MTRVRLFDSVQDEIDGNELNLVKLELRKWDPNNSSSKPRRRLISTEEENRETERNSPLCLSIYPWCFLFCFRFPRSFDFHDLSWSTHSVLVVFRTFLSFNFSNAFLKMTVKIVEFSVGFRISSLLFFSLAIQGRFQFSFIDISANDKGPLFLIRIECWTQNDGSRTGLTFPSFVLVWFHIHDRFYDVSGTSMNTSEYFLGMSLRAFLVFMNNVSGFSSCLPVWGRGKKGEGKKNHEKLKRRAGFLHAGKFDSLRVDSRASALIFPKFHTTT